MPSLSWPTLTSRVVLAAARRSASPVASTAQIAARTVTRNWLVV